MTAADTAEHSGPTLHISSVHNLRDFLQARGWTLAPWYEFDDEGNPNDTEVHWDYPPTFGGFDYDEDAEDGSPEPLTCGFSFEEDRIVLDVTTPGNPGGCPRHNVTVTTFAVDGHELTHLGPVLDILEPAAKTADLDELATCHRDGPCRNQMH